MEDEVFDNVNDNYQYFPASALTHPETPVDLGARGYQYGSWVFWRFLSEYFGTATAAEPAAVRAVWERADASPAGPDMYSLQAVAAVTRSVDVPFSRMFADLGAVNRFAHSWYFEGAAYPQAPNRKTHTLTLRASATGRWTARLNHLGNTNVTFVPGSGLRGSRRSRATLNLPDRARGRRRRSRRGSGTAGSGGTTLYLPFTRSKVAKVALTLTNASTRTRCGSGQPFS